MQLDQGATNGDVIRSSGCGNIESMHLCREPVNDCLTPVYVNITFAVTASCVFLDFKKINCSPIVSVRWLLRIC